MKALLALAALALAAGVRAAPVQVTSLIGAEVIDPQGKEPGVIEDLAIDMRGASVHYAILSTGSRVLFERSLHAVRLQALRPGLDRRQLVLDLDSPASPAAGRRGRSAIWWSSSTRRASNTRCCARRRAKRGWKYR